MGAWTQQCPAPDCTNAATTFRGVVKLCREHANQWPGRTGVEHGLLGPKFSGFKPHDHDEVK